MELCDFNYILLFGIYVGIKMTSKRTLKFDQNFFGAIHCMYTVIIALFLRETYTLYGASKFGYVWALLRDVFGVGAIIVIRLILGVQFEKGLHIVYFALCGFFIYYVVVESISKCMTAIKANTALLSFPHVIPLDLMISRCLFVFFTNIQSSIIVILLAIICGIDFSITCFEVFLYCILSSLLLGFSAGIFIAALTIFYPIIEKVWPIVRRLGFWCSGVFFTVDRFPSKYADFLSYNPILQLIEGLRSSLSYGINLVVCLNCNYINIMIITFLTFGLLLQKLSYGRLDS